MSAPPSDLAALAAALEGMPPAQILAAAAARHPGRIALACTFAPEECLLVDVIGRAGLLVDVFALESDRLATETDAIWRELESRYRLRIAAAPGGSTAPGPAVDRWARLLDARPDTLEAWVTGLRRDQAQERAGAKVIDWDARLGLVMVNPLAAWTTEQIRSALRQGGIPFGPPAK